MVNTKHVTDRRDVAYESMDVILGDVESLDHMPLRAAGNWTPAQILQHVGRVITLSIDGFPPDAKAPLALRLLGPLMKGFVLKRPMSSGIKFPGSFGFLEPDRNISWDDAIEDFRGVIARAGKEPMEAPSPIFGAMSHEDWTKLHCRHAEMHFSFILPLDD